MKVDLPPMVDDIGVALIEHGERGDEMDPANPMACLCGKFDPYYECDGPGVEALVLRPSDFGMEDESMVDLGGGMVVPLSELMDEP